jgi:hypothetical protein
MSVTNRVIGTITRAIRTTRKKKKKKKKKKKQKGVWWPVFNFFL